MEGSGFLTADGGDGDPYYGGGGSGGRIAVYANSNSFAGTMSAIGGDGFVTGAAGSTLLSTNPAFEIAALAPSGIVTNPVNSLIVTFSSPVSADSFVPSSDVALVTPSGPLPQDQFSAVALSPASFRVLIPSQTLPGDYAVTVGPNVTDIFGRVMSQVYTGAFTIDLPVIRGKVTDTNAIPVPGVLLQTSFAQTVTDTNGDYVIGFPAGANFSVTPLKTNLVFAPGSLSYSNLTASVSNQNYLALTTIAPQLNAALQSTNLALNWYGYPGVTYQLYRSTNLADWTLYGHPMFGSNAVIEIPLPVNGQSMEFFRAQANN